MHARTLAAAALWCCAAAVHAAGPVEANQATEAQLDSVKGLGPATTARILAARAGAAFKDWNDLIARVPGIGASKAKKLSAEGLTVNGAAFGALHPAEPSAAAAGSAQPASEP